MPMFMLLPAWYVHVQAPRRLRLRCLHRHRRRDVHRRRHVGPRSHGPNQLERGRSRVRGPCEIDLCEPITKSPQLSNALLARALRAAVTVTRSWRCISRATRARRRGGTSSPAFRIAFNAGPSSAPSARTRRTRVVNRAAPVLCCAFGAQQNCSCAFITVVSVHP